MAKRDDGGPAFARPVSEDRTNGDQVDGNDTVKEQNGLSVRDYMAAKVLQGIFAGHIENDSGKTSLLFWDHNLGWNNPNVPVMVANLAYDMADAMIVARSKN